MNQRTRLWLPIAIVLGVAVVAWLILSNPPQPNFSVDRRGPALSVETVAVQPDAFQVDIASYGIVGARTRTMLVAQVSGEIIDIADNFDEGGYFEQGDVLARIDPRDYRADVAIAEATLADAGQALAEEVARVEQALIDWERLGNEGEAPDLVLRKPQQAAAEARVISAEANLTKAKLDLERSVIRAPYRGRVLSQLVNLGQVVNTNTQLAEVFATDIAEVRLPIANADLPFVVLPEGSNGEPANAIIRSDLMGAAEWPAKIVRTEGAIDDQARQLHVLAAIDDPFRPGEHNRAPLKLGEYVTATLEGRVIPEAITIPISTIYQNAYVYVVVDGLLQRRAVDIAWSNADTALIASGLAAGDQLVTTILGQVTSGTEVTVRAATDGS